MHMHMHSSFYPRHIVDIKKQETSKHLVMEARSILLLDLVLDLIVVVLELLAQVGGDEPALGGLALGLAHDGHDRGGLGEEHLQLLQRAAHGLRVQEVDERDDGGGDDGVDDEVPVADGVDGDGGDLFEN